jgi:ribosomal protein S18 acetylase RimI-like enzyme
VTLRTRFRPAGPGDADRLWALVELCYRGDASRRGWTTEADILSGPRTSPREITAIVGGSGSEMLSGELGRELVACCQLIRRDDDRAHVGMVCVHPDLQGRGLGRALLAAAEDRAAREWGASVVSMQVFSIRTELIAWYGRLGYRPTGKTVAFEPPPEAGALVDGLRFSVLAKDLRRPATARASWRSGSG